MTYKASRSLVEASKRGEKRLKPPSPRTATLGIEVAAKALTGQGNEDGSRIRFVHGLEAYADPLVEQRDLDVSCPSPSSISWQEEKFVRRQAVVELNRPAIPKPNYSVPENPNTGLHLFRALLREASYLPDQIARRFFHDHVVRRFRVHASYGTTWARVLTDDSERARKDGQARLRKHLREARKGVKLLTNASHGSQSHLRKVLEVAYGRRGKRKHELLEDLMPKRAIPENNKALQELADALESDRAAPSTKTPELSEKLLALVKSQKGQQDRMFTKINIKSTKPVIPETNAWGRAFPKRRGNNVTRRWYRETLERVMPPLPKQDWQRLRDQAIGQGDWEGPPKRRAQTLVSETEPENQQEWHQITTRYMRRMWQAVFQQCPLIEWDDARSRWLVTWGYVKDQSSLSLQASMETTEGAFAEGEPSKIG